MRSLSYSYIGIDLEPIIEHFAAKQNWIGILKEFCEKSRLKQIIYDTIQPKANVPL